jgi:hypothetical protein
MMSPENASECKQWRQQSGLKNALMPIKHRCQQLSQWQLMEHQTVLLTNPLQLNKEVRDV